MNPRPTYPRHVHLLTAAGVLAVLAGVVVVALHDPAQPGFPLPTSCTFRRLTGLLCPGCGGTRGMHRLLHGDLLGALRFNPLTFLLLPVLAWAALAWLLRLWTPWRLPAFQPRPWMIAALAAALLVYGVLRNLPWPAFAWLRPPVVAPAPAADAADGSHAPGTGSRPPAAASRAPIADGRPAEEQPRARAARLAAHGAWRTAHGPRLAVHGGPPAAASDRSPAAAACGADGACACR